MVRSTEKLVSFWGRASFFDKLKTHRIPNADRVVRRCGGKTEAGMEIELLMRRRFVGHTEINGVLRPAALGKSSGVFEVGVQRLQELPVQIKARLAGEIPPACFGWPQQGEHSRRRPVLADGVRPWQLYARIIAVTGDPPGARRQAYRGDQGEIETAAGWPKLGLEAKTHICESRRARV